MAFKYCSIGFKIHELTETDA